MSRNVSSFASFLVTVAVVSSGLFVATSARAQSSYNHVVPAAYASEILVPYGHVVAVREARTDVGAPIIQWSSLGSDEQRWYLDEVHDRFNNLIGWQIRNKHSGLCIATDGVAGDQLYQAPCDPTNLSLIYDAASNGGLANLATGWVLDVWGASDWAGAGIDLWPANGQWNQLFLVFTSFVSP